jgi:hypothetical protein
MAYKDTEEYRKANRARVHKWRVENPQKARDLKNRWRANNPDKDQAQRQRHREKHREKRRADGLDYYRKNRGRNVLNKLKRKERAAGRRKPEVCDVCGGSNGGIQFDHCHERGIFRGWLCNNCNCILGHAKDNADVLRKLIAYLERTAKLVPPQLTLPV